MGADGERCSHKSRRMWVEEEMKPMINVSVLPEHLTR